MESILDGTYVINMDSDIVRLQEFDTMMTACNWNYSRHPAINGKKMLYGKHTPEELETVQPQLALKHKYIKPITWLNSGEIGCLLSHVSLWEEVANNPDKNRIAIFEDDARTHISGDTFQTLLSDFYGYLKENNIPEPDMLYLGKALDDCMSYEKVWGNVYKTRHPLCLHAYIITKHGAQQLLEMSPYFYAIDVIPIRAINQKKINVMTFHPSLFFQDVFNSTSNLRNFRNTINHTTECVVPQQHVSGDTWQFTFVIVIGLIAAIILFAAFMWLTLYKI